MHTHAQTIQNLASLRPTEPRRPDGRRQQVVVDRLSAHRPLLLRRSRTACRARRGQVLHDLVDHVAAPNISGDIFLIMLEEHRAPGSTRAGMRAAVQAGGARL